MMNNFNVNVTNTFNLTKTLECGQCFHFKKLGNAYLVFGDRKVCLAEQSGNKLYIKTDDNTPDYWLNYFGLLDNYTGIIAKLTSHAVAMEDSFALKSIKTGEGIRLLHQPLFETACSFIISQQNRIPRIQQIVFNISEKFGDYGIEVGGTKYYCFPSPTLLSQATVDDFNSLGLGYRSPYLYSFIHSWDKIKSKIIGEYDSDFNLFKSCYGIGDKVANCICLYGLHETNAFPVDTWIKKVLNEEYYSKGLNFIPPRENAGLLQQFMFYTKRNNL